MKRRLTEEEKAVFEDAMRLTSGQNLHMFRIMSWTVFNRKKFWNMVDNLKSGMHWWAAYDKSKNM